MSTVSRIAFANTLRGFGVLTVLVTHYYGVFWTDRQIVAHLTNAPLLTMQAQATPHFVTYMNQPTILSWGNMGVALFFLISGFVIPFSFKSMDWRAFAINRIFRLLPTYFVGFTITLLAVVICSLYFHREFPYQIKQVLAHYIPGLRDILHYPSIDGIIWSLEIEVKFYVLCAFIAGWFQSGSLKVFYIPIFLGVLAILLSINASPTDVHDAFYRARYGYLFVSQYIIFTYIGVVFHYIHRKIIRTETAFVLMLLFFTFFALIRQGQLFTSAFPLTWSYGFGFLLFTFAFANPNFFRSNRFLDFLADVSYPFYVIHGVAGYAAVRFLLLAGVNPAISLFIVSIGVIIAALIVHRYIELPGQLFGRKLQNALRERSAKKTEKSALIPDTGQ